MSRHQEIDEAVRLLRSTAPFGVDAKVWHDGGFVYVGRDGLEFCCVPRAVVQLRFPAFIWREFGRTQSCIVS